jgi:uncharacterized membrane protein YjfL (UPF0719 family)
MLPKYLVFLSWGVIGIFVIILSYAIFGALLK